MPIKEHRRLANEAKAIVAETQRTTEELKKCVAQSRALLSESKLVLAQSTAAAACFYVHRLDRDQEQRPVL